MTGEPLTQKQLVARIRKSPRGPVKGFTKQVTAAAQSLAYYSGRGEDVTDWPAALSRAYARSHHVGQMQDLADVLVAHWLRAGALEAFEAQVRATKYPVYFMRALDHADGARLDPAPLVPLLARLLPGADSGLGSDVIVALSAYVRRRPARLLSVLDELRSHAPRSIGPLLTELAVWRGFGIGAAAPLLVKLLEHGVKEVREAAAQHLAGAASQGADVSTLMESLEGRLAACEPQVRESLGFALARSGLPPSALAWERVDRGLAHEDLEVRRGAMNALAGATREAMLTGAASRCLDLAADADPEISRTAGRALTRAQRQAREQRVTDAEAGALADAAALARAAARVPAAAAPLGACVYWQIGRDPERAALVGGALAGVSSGSAAGLLLGAAREIAAGTHRHPCGICRHLERQLSVTRESEVPALAYLLVPKVKLMGEQQTLTCPECGIAYCYEHEVEEIDDRPSVDHFRFRRQPAGDGHPGPDTASLRAQLDSPDPAVRREAAWSLVTRQLDRGDAVPVLTELLTHAQDEVRHEALVGMLARGVGGEGLVKLPRPAPDRGGLSIEVALRSRLDDPSPEVRTQSGRYLAHLLLAAKDWTAIAELLKAPNELVQTAVSMVVAPRLHGAKEVSQLAGVAQANILAGGEKLRDASSTLLERASCEEPQRSQAVAFARGLLDAGDPLCTLGARLLQRLEENGADVGPFLADLGRRMDHATVNYVAVQIGLSRAKSGKDVTALLPGLAHDIVHGDQSYLWDRFWLCELALGAPGAEILIPALAQLVPKPASAQRAICCLKKAAENGYDITGAVPALEGALLKPEDGFECEQAAHGLVEWWMRTSSWKRIADELAAQREGVCGPVLSWLERTAGTRDWTPVLPAVVDALCAKHPYERECAERAVRAYLERDAGAPAVRVELARVADRKSDQLDLVRALVLALESA